MLRALRNSRAAYGLYLLLAVAFLFELAIRVVFAFEVGPRVLLYGSSMFRNTIVDNQEERLTRTFSDPEFVAQARNDKDTADESVVQHLNSQGEYTKFFPNEVKFTYDVDTGEAIPVQINSRGFRGPDFSTKKPQGTVRVLTLGSSSTFGFYDRDNETYPFYLGEVLNETCPSTTFEVINFAIPHMFSSHVAALYRAEAAELSPDVATFYEGRNESMYEPPTESAAGKIYSVLVHRLLSVAFVDQVLFANRESVTAAGELFEPRVARIKAEYFKNLDSILEASRESGTLLIVANQQSSAASPFPAKADERLARKGLTYAAEAARVKRRLDESNDLNEFEYTFLIHQQLMSSLQDWAKQENVPFVDVIGALDDQRHYLLSWLHLHPEANKIVARHLAAPILERFCPSQR